MTLLVSNFVLCVIYAIVVYSLPIDKWRKEFFFLFLTIVQISILHGLVDVYTVPDLFIYEDVYHDVDEKSILDVLIEPGLDDGSDYERGFKLYQKFFATFFSDFNVFLIINSYQYSLTSLIITRSNSCYIIININRVKNITK